jgi:hypothetical protein
MNLTPWKWWVKGEPSVATDYSPNAKGCGELPFCFSGQGQDGFLGVHPSWHGLTWKRRHPARTRLVLVDAVPFAQRGQVTATLLAPGDEQVADEVGWLLDAFASLAGDAGTDEEVDAFIVPGDVVRAPLGAGEARVLAFEGLSGSRVTFVARRASGEVQPALTLLGPDGLPRLLAQDTVQGEQLARVRRHLLDATGVWTLVLEDVGGSPGDVEVKSAARNPPRLVETLQVGGAGGAPGLVFEAVGGIVVRGTRVRRVPPPPDGSVPDEIAEQLTPDVAALLSAGSFEFDLRPLATTNALGTRVRVDPFEVPSLGAFTLRIDGVDGGQGYVRVRIRRELPRGHEALLLDG